MTTIQVTRPEQTGLVVGAHYDSVARVMLVQINGVQHAVSTREAQELAEAICRASDSRLTAHPVDFDRAACLIHAGVTADLAVA